MKVNNFLPETHPASALQDYSDVHWIFCDDSIDEVDRHYKTQIPERVSHQKVCVWVSVVIESKSYDLIRKQILDLKREAKVEILSCKDSAVFEQFKSNKTFRDKLLNVLSSDRVQLFISFSSYKKIENADLIEVEGWQLNNPFDYPLFLHLRKLDQHFKIQKIKGRFFTFCDRTGSTTDYDHPTAGWYQRPHPYLEVIEPQVCHELKSARDTYISIGLELADFAAWGIRRTFEKIRARDSSTNMLVTDIEFEQRVRNLCYESDHSLATVVVGLLRNGRSQFLSELNLNQKIDN
ncbi:MAG: hypothetical protein COX62_07435 [Deltaproteobacteria bacterium CG_4_10_14_0_2_um_filter_43_8]|nr:MAG: hypothetical protein COV43_06180 [Deltaproteobacteria bacterium CG11_big_fil_rev_8_21_14_0_20_42_23]PJA19044.1 MAG: hypothetical protein COX62_07435 [Deltaproteobacteria bacterium CG_4_10_14_0_2_um_filter_43_8]PJC65180.1 MAG: hypothetical protein CO021_00575 [Deltaproteobacteria bacterium CG_4_9_14_0_2_um_filter_42_21]